MQRRLKSFGIFFLAGVFSLALVVAPSLGAIVTWTGGTGNWTTSSNWSNNAVPGAGNNYGINNDGTATIDSVVPDISDLGLGWPTGNTRSGHVEIQAGGSLTTTSTDGVDVGVRGGTSNMSSLNITGGALNITGFGHLVMGDEAGSHGTVEISSGSIAVSGNMRIGIQGEGNFVIHGNSPTINVAGNLTFHENGSAFSRLILDIGAGGISPIQVAGNTTLDNNPELLVSLSALAPLSDLVLVDSSPTSSVILSTTFFGLADGAPVSATLGLTTYNWTIDYGYGIDNNDIALVFVSVETVPEPGTATLGAFGLLALGCVARRWRRTMGG